MSKRYKAKIARGVGQLTIVEHSLCPCSQRLSLVEDLGHETSYQYSDPSRRRRVAKVRVLCPLGLLPEDELYLWGMLALTFNDPDSEEELIATRHYILRKLGIIDAATRRGGRQYARFSDAIRRLAAVRYHCTAFYDPIRAEHCERTFGFFSYSRPMSENSSRAWRIVWDRLFLELASPTGGALRFDFPTYRTLDVASRRIYLYLAKLFGRKEKTHALDVDDLAINTVGYSPTLSPSVRRFKIKKCLTRLAQEGVILNEEQAFLPGRDGRHRVVLRRGPLFAKSNIAEQIESPFAEALASFGLDAASIQRVVQTYPNRMLAEWIDITIAARERFGRDFFRRSEAAFFIDNIKNAKAGRRGPPDWWFEIRKAEEQARAERAKKRARSTQGPDQFPQKAMDSLDNVRETIFKHFVVAGQPEEVARANAKQFAEATSKKGTVTE